MRGGHAKDGPEAFDTCHKILILFNDSASADGPAGLGWNKKGKA
jgi:hypothetical protein